MDIQPITIDSPIVVRMPTATMSIDRPRRGPSPVAMASAPAMMGVMSGATIMAPMTVAVESARMPPVAMITESTSRTANRRYGSRVPSRSK